MNIAFDAILSPLKAASDAAEKILQVKGILEYGDVIRKLHEDVLSGLKAAQAAEVTQIAMQQEIQSLKSEVANLKATNAQLERYELKRLPPGVSVYALKSSEEGTEQAHYACENCFSNGKIKHLHSRGNHHGLETLHCNGCNSDIKTGTFSPPKPEQPNRLWSQTRR